MTRPFAFSGFREYNSGMDRLERIQRLTDRLISANETYESYLNASPWGILVVDKNFKILFMNERLEELSGYTLKELSGKHLHSLMPKSVHKIHRVHEQEFSENPRARTGNHGLHPRVLHKNGEQIDVEISLSPAVVHEEVVYFASIRRLETLFDTIEGKIKGT